MLLKVPADLDANADDLNTPTATYHLPDGIAGARPHNASGNYLWQQSDDTIHSRPVVISPYMPDIAAGSIPVTFGDLSYFWILERQPLSVKILTELYSRENLTGYAAYERIDGRLIRPEAVQLLTIK